MIIRKDGKINEIVYNNTVYNNGEYRYYLPITSLLNLIELIIKTNVTTKSITITPFYRNVKIKKQIEFTNMMFYLECDDLVTDQRRKDFINECCENDIDEQDIQMRYCLCDNDDIVTFQLSLRNYYNYLISIFIPKVTDLLINCYNLELDELLCGYVCFEVYSE